MPSTNALTHAQYVLINRLAVPLGGFILLIIIARHSDKLLGQYALVMTFYYVMQMLPLLGLTSFIMREVARVPEQAGRFFVSIGALSMLGCVAVDISCYGFLQFTDYDTSVVHAIGLLGLLIFPGILAFIAEIIFMSVHQARPVAWVAVVENIVRVAGSAVVLISDHGVYELVMVLCLTRFGALVTYIITMKRTGVVTTFGLPSTELLRRTLRVLPVFLWGSIVFTVLSRLDFLVLSMLEQVETLGHYAIAYRLYEVFAIILTAVIMAMFPWVSKSFVGARKHYVVAVHSIAIVFSSGLVLLSANVALFAENYVLLLFPDQYPAPVLMSQLFAAAIFITGMDFLASGILHASDEQTADIRSNTLGGGVLTVLLLALVPAYGIIGALLAKVVSSLTQGILKFVAMNRSVGLILGCADFLQLALLAFMVSAPVIWLLDGSVLIKLAVVVLTVTITLLFLIFSNSTHPMRILRFYRRPQIVDDVTTVANLVDMLLADERRRTRQFRHGMAHAGGRHAQRDRLAVILYRCARFLYLKRRVLLAGALTHLNTLLFSCAIDASVKAGPGLVINGAGTVQAEQDIEPNTTFGPAR